MNPRFSLLLASVLAAFSTRAAEFKFGAQTFTLPEGFVLERVAGPGLVERPIEADFDEQGRLYVTDSSGSNEKVTEQLQKKPHRIMRLEDTDGDGIFDKSTVFADKMMFPEGAMWFDGSLYVSAPPVIWKLTDTDGDGVADKREEWFDAKTLTGCANDLHGPYLGLDGWIYWSKGAFAKQTYERPNGKRFETRAAHIFRRRPEGGLVEPVMTGGMDNPVGVVFTPEGERIFTTTFFQHPGGGQRDGLIHAIYGGVYGKVNDVTDDHKKTGELMPVLTQLGPAAPCGLARYESEVFGKSYRDNLFACLFNLHKVTRHVLKPKGGTYQTEDSDFLTSDSTDFHPTDVLEDADGSLLVIDTGGWYKICCPTSQLWKPDMLGAIYRIRRADAARVSDARGMGLDWKSPSAAELVQRLNDARPVVVRRATQALRKGNGAADELRRVIEGSAPVAQKRNAVWALTGSSDAKAKEAIHVALSSGESSVQHAAVHAVSVMRDESAFSALLPLLASSDPQVRRATAEALGRLGNAEAVPVLLNAAARLTSDANAPVISAEARGHKYQAPDRVLEHSIAFALIEIDDAKATRAGLKSEHALTQRAALIALDQMDSGDLKPEEVTAFLEAGRDPVLNQAANWIIAHHKDWGGPVAEYLETELLGSKKASAAERGELEQRLQNLAGSPAIQQMLANVSAGESAPREARLLALDALKRSRAKDVGDAWFVVKLLRSSDAELVQRAAAVAGAVTFRSPEVLREELLKVAASAELPAATRLEALNAMPAGAGVGNDLFALLSRNLAPELPMNVRTLATSIIGKSKLTDDQLVELAQELKRAGPLEISKLVDAYEKSSSEPVGAALVSNLHGAKGLAGVHPDRLKQVLAKYPESVREQAKELLASLNQDANKQAAYIDELLPKLQKGDVRRGQTIFNSTRAACSGCHAIGYLGGNLGPDLTRVGQVRTERDLLEAIVYPSASFVRSFEPYIVVTKNGDDFSGVLRKDATDEVLLGTGPNVEVRIARNDIAEMRPGKTSVMPQGLNEQLSQQEMADLLAFLKSTRW
jgi:putative membrane-bound dehydrogenase-like protein